jgi:hypothetical protein
LFLSLSIGGIWLMRAAQPRGQKTVALLLLGIAVGGAGTIITQANAGPPPSFQLAQSFAKLERQQTNLRQRGH